MVVFAICAWIVGRYLTHVAALRPSELSEVHSSTSRQSAKEESEICQFGRMVTDLFSCAKEHELPLFARDGFLLGVVRESSFVHFGEDSYDDDVDIGCLEEDYGKILDFFVATAANNDNNSCLSSKGLQIRKVQLQPPGTLYGCVAPSQEVQTAIESSAHSSELDPDLRSNLENLCNIPSRIGGFVASLDRGDASLPLSLSVFPRAQTEKSEVSRKNTTNPYILDLACDQSWNCPNELRMWYLYDNPRYHPVQPGQEMIRHYPEELFKPFRTVEFQLTSKEHGSIMIPKNAERYLELSYGRDWNVARNKQDLAAEVTPASKKSFVCGA
eukprot:TRINITY_DN74514_c0_g1_i1.p1 TRINITY_DN74514_c0_g1~~TRINITY_DN74514_c0_g1_i1.p1  ORF type:complete len:346 (+),score=28.02 TRINITY_DN74514_c0_g1_i1:57-1040(+)